MSTPTAAEGTAGRPELVVFGAGMVGRGLLGELFCSAGWAVHFLDVDQAMVEALDQDGSYLHVVVSNQAERRTRVAPVSAGLANSAAAVDRLVAADLAATAVGPRALPGVAAVVAEAIATRQRRGHPPLNLLLCENLHDAAGEMAGMLVEAAGSPQVLDGVGLVRTSIGRMIPGGVFADGSTAVRAEPYGFLPVDPAGLVAPPPLPLRVVRDPDVVFDFYADRKLYVHNMGHFLAALLGRCVGLDLVWQVVERPDTRQLVRAAMVESALALGLRYRQPLGGLLAHVDALLHRFGNRALADSVERVGRDPQRKLQPGDRLLGAAALCRAEGIGCPHIELAIWLGEAAVAGRPVSPEQLQQRLLAAQDDHASVDAV